MGKGGWENTLLNVRVIELYHKVFMYIDRDRDIYKNCMHYSNMKAFEIDSILLYRVYDKSIWKMQ